MVLYIAIDLQHVSFRYQKYTKLSIHMAKLILDNFRIVALRAEFC